MCPYLWQVGKVGLIKVAVDVDIDSRAALWRLRGAEEMIKMADDIPTTALWVGCCFALSTAFQRQSNLLLGG